MSKLARNITRLRTSMGLSGRQLAKLVRIDHSYLSRIETGEQDPEKISWGVLQRLSKALKVPLGELTNDPGYRKLDRLLGKMSDEDLKIFNAITGLSPDNARRQATLEILGLRRPRAKRGKVLRKATSR